MSAGGLLAGRRAVVTGAARGIGLLVAERYAQEGAAVVLADIDAGRARREAARIGAATTEIVTGAGVDVTDEASVTSLAELTTARLGGVDIVVANAGMLLLRPVLETDLEDWRRVLDVNLTGAFITCKIFGQRLVRQGSGGRMVLTSSLFGLRGGAENGAYAASKFGMVGLTQTLAAELAPHGVLVNAVCPGQVDTPMMRQLFADRALLRGTDPASVEADMVRQIPMGRMADPAEIADLYVFLASPLSRYLTGQSLLADGGLQVG